MSKQYRIGHLVWGLWMMGGAVCWGSGADAEPRRLDLNEGNLVHCLAVLRLAIDADEFWPAMHAAEALTRAGYGNEVRKRLAPRLAAERDDQHRCGLARELVRAGDRSQTAVLFEILAKPDPYGHTHACESLYKVNEVGDGMLLRAAFAQREDMRCALMAAAALGRQGDPSALAFLRRELDNPDPELAKIAAWVLARIGGAQDMVGLRRARARHRDAITLAYFDHALAALGDAAGLTRLRQNLASPDPTIRTYAATFAGDARAWETKEALIRLLADEHLDTRVRAAQSLLVMAGRPD